MKRNLLMLAGLFFTAVVSSQDLTQHLLLRYHFDGNANDSGAYAYHATPVNTTYVADRFGVANKAIHFNGIDSYVEFPNLAALKPQLPVSFSFWINYEGESYQQQAVFNTSMQENMSSSVVFNSVGVDNHYVINCADGSYYYAPETRRSYISNSRVDPNAWHFIAIVVNTESNMKIYVDCVEAGGTYSGSGGSLAYSANPGCLGKHDRSLSLPPDYFLGAIDDFRYWDKGLTQSDINKLCSDELAVDEISSVVNEVLVYQDLSDGLLHIQSNAADRESVAVYNAMGQRILVRNYAPVIDVGRLAAGVYFVKVQGRSGSHMKKIIIR